MTSRVRIGPARVTTGSALGYEFIRNGWVELEASLGIPEGALQETVRRYNEYAEKGDGKSDSKSDGKSDAKKDKKDTSTSSKSGSTKKASKPASE